MVIPFWEFKLFKKNLIHKIVVMLSCMNQDFLNPLLLVASNLRPSIEFFDRPTDCPSLNKLGPCTHYRHNLHSDLPKMNPLVMTPCSVGIDCRRNSLAPSKWGRYSIFTPFRSFLYFFPQALQSALPDRKVISPAH